MGFKIWCQVSNLMSSWGSWSKISKLQQVRDFSFCGSKSSLLKHTYQVSFWKSNCWGSWSKISTLLQVGDFLGLKVRFWNTRKWCNFGNRKQHFYGFVIWWDGWTRNLRNNFWSPKSSIPKVEVGIFFVKTTFSLDW